VQYENGMVAELADREGKPERPKDGNTAALLVEQAKASPHRVLSVSRTEVERRPPAPFTTSTLQQTASNRLGFVPAKTMKVAQELFEGGHISYHRTDSVSLSADAVALARGWIEQHQPGSLPEKPPSYRSQAGAQEAHEAIRPTSLAWPAELSAEQKALYDLIRTRFLASQMRPARLARTLVLTETPDKVLVFAARGTTVLEAHWLGLEQDEEEAEAKKKDRKDELEEQRLPALQEGQELAVQDAGDVRKQTRPPARFTEAGLVKEMERLGIGRPSTYAATIETLYRRSYVVAEKKSLGPTALGLQVDELMLAGLASLTSHEYTAAMELELDKIAAGEQSWRGYLQAWWGTFEPELGRAAETWSMRLAELQAKASAGDAGAARVLGRDPAAPTCPECGQGMRKLNGPKGPFWACSGYPKCRKTLPVAAQAPAKKGEEPKAIACKQCGKPMVEREGKAGRFLSCSGFPACKQTAPIELTQKRARKCPKCGQVLARRKGPKGDFLGCTGFPECRYTEDRSSKKAASC
jgi:DNA topoisomerase-1